MPYLSLANKSFSSLSQNARANIPLNLDIASEPQ